ncbi:MAG: A/G-specific adenine glycosylase [Methylococcales bacterium]|nr:A/G-specific adenine glycosylase [Methylococcales bacterium]
MTPTDFQQQVLDWFDVNGRKDLPWQQDITPYSVWLSETMLQQTQVSTVIPYFNAFIQQFPSIEDLAAAPIDAVLHRWSGLGYYARARNLHKCAQQIVKQGYFPDTLDGLIALPGIGLSTAGAILSIAFKNSHPILDGNVRRVLARFKAISGWTGSTAVNKQLWLISKELTPQLRVADYTQAMMDLGATLCTRSKPACNRCPLNNHCLAKANDLVHLLPTPKPSKTIPVKQLTFLLLKNNHQEIALVKRPPTGIWGGLWSLPEFDSIATALEWCATKHLPIIESKTLAPQRHTFSHYHLDYSTLIINTENPINFVMEAEQTVWYKVNDIGSLGLPAPIKILLQHNTEI